MPKCTIHKDKTLSLETAKLLGVPFTWGSCSFAFKFAWRGGKLQVFDRCIAPSRIEHHWRPVDSEVAHSFMCVTKGARTFYLVEFPDENDNP